MGNYCIKDGYEHQTVNATLEQKPGGYWQGKRDLLNRYCQMAGCHVGGRGSPSQRFLTRFAIQTMLA